MKIRCAYDKMVPLEDLKPNPKNRNKHPASQVRHLARIFKAQGIRKPIIVSNRSGLMTIGHGRLLAAKLLKMKTYPVNFQDYDDKAQEYADMVADNAVALQAEIDMAGVNADIGDLGPDFNVDLLGIPGFTVDVADKGLIDEDAVPEPRPKGEVKTKLGDVYLLGRHRLMCGDSIDSSAIKKLMNGEKADMVFTDPPYNLGGHMKTGIYSGTSLKSHVELSETKWDDDFDIKPVVRNLLCVLAENASMYICTSHFLAGDIWAETKETMDRIGWCVWEKPNPTPSMQKRHWTWCAELICYATKGKHVFNFPDAGHAPNIWRFNKEAHTEGHPTQKPVSIPEHGITHSSKADQIVLDLFGGSGSTLIACEKTNRRCFMMELDPGYCDVIVSRWEQFTGLKAKLVKSKVLKRHAALRR